MGQIISLVSGKGGVGKTTSAINLAYSFLHFGRNVVLVEANLKTPHISVLLGFPNIEKTMHSILEKKHHILESSYLHYSGLKVVLGDLKGKHYHPPHIISGIESALKDLKESVEIVVVDTPPHHAIETYYAMRASDYVIIVTTSDSAAITEALKTIRIARSLGKKILGVIVTRRTDSKHELSIDNIEKMLEYKVIGIIPEDEDIMFSQRIGHPVTFSHPDSSSSIKYKEIAAYLLGKKYSNSKKLEIEDDPFFKLVQRLKK